MRGLTSAVLWWEESQLRVLVLTSQLIQIFLLFFPLLRRQAISGRVRFILWLAYHAGDAVAIYALATLFNRHKADQAGEDCGGGGGGGGNTLLEVVWAPVLLIHLGGSDGVTAYNIEDNELWTRHLLTAVSQVTVAIYVFCKTWPPGGDKRLLQAAILLFVPGLLKCFDKSWAFKRASIYSLVSSATAVKQKEGEMKADGYVTRAKDFVLRQQTATTDTDLNKGDGTIREEGETQGAMEDYEGRRPNLNDMAEPADTDDTEERALETLRQVQKEMNMLFVDLSSPYSRRLTILELFCGLTEKGAYDSVRLELAIAFLLLYTKFKATTINFLWIQVSRLLPWAAIGLFQHSHREAYNPLDVKITYVLLCCTAAVEFFSGGFLAEQGDSTDWPETVGQRSFIGYVAARSNKQMRIVSRLLGLGCCCKDFLDKQHYWRERPCFSSCRITGLVHQYLKAGWKQKMHDAESYRRFNDNRGHWALEVEGNQDHLGWSIKGPFDESVLRWHIATEFCFFLSSSSSAHRCAFAEVPPVFMMPTSWIYSQKKLRKLASWIRETIGRCPPSIDEERNDDRTPCSEELTNCKAILCRQMSNYMAYLLLVNPEMLLPGSRRNLCTRAQEELEDILFKKNNNGDKPPLGFLDKRALAEKIVSKLRSSSSSSSQEASSPPPPETFIDEAWKLAQGLQNLGDQKMWEVIQGVWVEMLCYSAGRCRGYLHAKALGKGGEFLSYVWLLMFYMGMETFTDKLQREDEAAGTGNNSTAGPTASTSERVSSTTGGTAASASEAHADDAAGATDSPSTCEIRKAEDMV